MFKYILRDQRNNTGAKNTKAQAFAIKNEVGLNPIIKSINRTAKLNATPSP